MRNWQCLWLGWGSALAASRIVVFVYHHVADDTPAATSIGRSAFEQHLDEIAASGRQVVDLAEAVAALRVRRALPEGAVALTFDDAWRSIYTTARPMLEARGWPYTIFVSTDAIDDGLGGYMSWQELRQAARGGASIANHSASHDHLLARNDLGRRQWLARVRADILRAGARIADEIGTRPELFSWPYGEFDRDLLHLLAGLGLVGFGQQSGPIGMDSHLGALPRFPVSGAHSTIDAFVLRLNTWPLPATIEAPDWRRPANAAAPRLTLRMDSEAFARRVSCFLGTGEALTVARSAVDPARVHVRRNAPLGPGRAKYTCTAPHEQLPGAWYWYSHPWFTPDARGRFPD